MARRRSTKPCHDTYHHYCAVAGQLRTLESPKSSDRRRAAESLSQPLPVQAAVQNVVFRAMRPYPSLRLTSCRPGVMDHMTRESFAPQKRTNMITFTIDPENS